MVKGTSHNVALCSSNYATATSASSPCSELIEAKDASGSSYSALSLSMLSSNSHLFFADAGSMNVYEYSVTYIAPPPVPPTVTTTIITDTTPSDSKIDKGSAIGGALGGFFGALLIVVVLLVYKSVYLKYQGMSTKDIESAIDNQSPDNTDDEVAHYAHSVNDPHSAQV